jgi:hypothetical protein
MLVGMLGESNGGKPPLRPWTDYSPEKGLAFLVVTGLVLGVFSQLFRHFFSQWGTSGVAYWIGAIGGGAIGGLIPFGLPLLRVLRKDGWLVRRDLHRPEGTGTASGDDG